MRSGIYRGYTAPIQKIDSIYRILCLGDSMVYGQGVPIDQTLPAHLENLLNQACPNRLIEVINEGFCGFSAYETWTHYLLNARAVNPDLAVITLCENDSELFSVKLGEYTEHTNACWDPKYPHLRYFTKLLKEIAEYSMKEKLPILIAFYYLPHSPLRAQIQKTLSSLTQELKLEFVDISTEFVGTYDYGTNLTMRVSDTDGHPSSLSHSIAARSLANSIIRKHLPPVHIREQQFLGQLNKNASDSIHAGYFPVEFLSRLEKQVQNKKRSKARLKLPEALRAPDEAFDKASASILRTASLCSRVMEMLACCYFYLDHSRPLQEGWEAMSIRLNITRQTLVCIKTKPRFRR
jgi:lysophospholipase L1-like esterase